MPPVGSAAAVCSPVLAFRFSPMYDSGKSTRSVRLQYGVSTDDMNAAIAASVCGSGSGVFLLYVPMPSRTVRVVRLRDAAPVSELDGYAREEVRWVLYTVSVFTVWGSTQLVICTTAAAGGEGGVSRADAASVFAT